MFAKQWAKAEQLLASFIRPAGQRARQGAPGLGVESRGGSRGARGPATLLHDWRDQPNLWSPLPRARARPDYPRAWPVRAAEGSREDLGPEITRLDHRFRPRSGRLHRGHRSVGSMMGIVAGVSVPLVRTGGSRSARPGLVDNSALGRGRSTRSMSPGHDPPWPDLMAGATLQIQGTIGSSRWHRRAAHCPPPPRRCRSQSPPRRCRGGAAATISKVGSSIRRHAAVRAPVRTVVLVLAARPAHGLSPMMDTGACTPGSCLARPLDFVLCPSRGASRGRSSTSRCSGRPVHPVLDPFVPALEFSPTPVRQRLVLVERSQIDGVPGVPSRLRPERGPRLRGPRGSARLAARRPPLRAGTLLLSLASATRLTAASTLRARPGPDRRYPSDRMVSFHVDL